MVIVGGGGDIESVYGIRSVISVIAEMFHSLCWAVFACFAGSVVYVIVVRKHISVKDLFWVSQSKFNDTVKSMQSGLKLVTGVLSAVRKDLG